MNGEDEAGVSNEHDDVDGTPEDSTSPADSAADETTSPEADGTAAGTDSVAEDGPAADGSDPVDAVDLSKPDEGDDEDEDESAENADGELVAVGAAAGSARAAARRSAVRSGVTEKKGRATLARDGDREKEANAFQRLGRFLREVVAELRKVIWPHRKQLITYTTVVPVFVVFMTALVFGLDALFARAVLAVFGGG